MALEVYKLEQKYNNFFTLVQKALVLYSVSNNLNNPENHLRRRLSEVLTYYVLEGYSKATKDLVVNSIKGMNYKHLNQINSELQSKGYLHKSRENNNLNDNKRVVDKSLLQLRDYLQKTKNGKPLIIIQFIKTEEQF